MRQKHPSLQRTVQSSVLSSDDTYAIAEDSQSYLNSTISPNSGSFNPEASTSMSISR